jgi:hypothetical protein
MASLLAAVFAGTTCGTAPGAAAEAAAVAAAAGTGGLDLMGSLALLALCDFSFALTRMQEISLQFLGTSIRTLCPPKSMLWTSASAEVLISASAATTRSFRMGPPLRADGSL